MVRDAMAPPPRQDELWRIFAMLAISRSFIVATGSAWLLIACGGGQEQHVPATPTTSSTAEGDVVPQGTTAIGGNVGPTEINPPNNSSVTGVVTMSPSQSANMTNV